MNRYLYHDYQRPRTPYILVVGDRVRPDMSHPYIKIVEDRIKLRGRIIKIENETVSVVWNDDDPIRAAEWKREWLIHE